MIFAWKNIFSAQRKYNTQLADLLIFGDKEDHDQIGEMITSRAIGFPKYDEE